LAIGRQAQVVELSDLLLDRTARTLAGTGIRARALTANRQTTAMTVATVATEVHQTLDAHGHFAAQVAFDGEFADLGAQRFEFGFGQVRTWTSGFTFACAQIRFGRVGPIP